MGARQIRRHEPVKPEVGQSWFLGDKLALEIIKIWSDTPRSKMVRVADLAHPRARQRNMTMEHFMKLFPSAEVWLPRPKPVKTSWVAVFRLSHESFNGYEHSDGEVTVKVNARVYKAEAEVRARTRARKLFPGHDCRLVSLTPAYDRHFRIQRTA